MTPEDRQNEQLIDELKALSPRPAGRVVVWPRRAGKATWQHDLNRALNSLAAAKGTEIHNAAMKR